MGWFNNKPKEGDIHNTILPEEGKKLNGKHPVIIESNNKDDTCNVIGCSSKYHPELKDVKVNSTPKMYKDTYARVEDGVREMGTDKLLNKIGSCNNLKNIRRKLNG
jgi:hypothetical protein